MTTELILDEEGLRHVLKYYLEAMRNKSEAATYQMPIDPRYITRVEIEPAVKKVKVIFEWNESK